VAGRQHHCHRRDTCAVHRQQLRRTAAAAAVAACRILSERTCAFTSGLVKIYVALRSQIRARTTKAIHRSYAHARQIPSEIEISDRVLYNNNTSSVLGYLRMRVVSHSHDPLEHDKYVRPCAQRSIMARTRAYIEIICIFILFYFIFLFFIEGRGGDEILYTSL